MTLGFHFSIIAASRGLFYISLWIVSGPWIFQEVAKKAIFFLTIPIFNYCFFGLFSSASCIFVELYFELASFFRFFFTVCWCIVSGARQGSHMPVHLLLHIMLIVFQQNLFSVVSSNLSSSMQRRATSD